MLRVRDDDDRPRSPNWSSGTSTGSSASCTTSSATPTRPRTWPRRCSCGSTAPARSTRPKAKFSTWLFTIANNLALNALRDRQRQAGRAAGRAATPARSARGRPEQLAADPRRSRRPRTSSRQELADVIRRALDGLNERQRMAVVLNKFEDMNYAEIAEVMGLTTKAVKSLLSRAAVPAARVPAGVHLHGRRGPAATPNSTTGTSDMADDPDPRPTRRRTTAAPDPDADLIAYLDGELDGPDGARRSRPGWPLDPAARTRADAYKKTFDLLDYLPRPEPSPDFATRTLTRLQPATSRERQRRVAASPVARSLVAPSSWLARRGAGRRRRVRRPRRPAAVRRPAPTELSYADVRVIENLPLYLGVDDLDFLRALDDAELFAPDPAAGSDGPRLDVPPANREKLEATVRCLPRVPAAATPRTRPAVARTARGRARTARPGAGGVRRLARPAARPGPPGGARRPGRRRPAGRGPAGARSGRGGTRCRPRPGTSSSWWPVRAGAARAGRRAEGRRAHPTGGVAARPPAVGRPPPGPQAVAVLRPGPGAGGGRVRQDRAEGRSGHPPGREGGPAGGVAGDAGGVRTTCGPDTWPRSTGAAGGTGSATAWSSTGCRSGTRTCRRSATGSR